MSILTARNLKKEYKKRTVVQDASLELHSGEVIGLLGPNGAGKTTTFSMIVGLVQPNEGQISIDNQEVTYLPIHQRARLGLGYLPQEMSIFRKLNVEDNIRAILELQGLKRHQIDLKLEELLDQLDITHLRKESALSLSGGERRRAEIARALATSPKFILLDEPFAGVDPIAVIDIQEIIRFLVKHNIGVLITDHNVRETLGICNRAYIISQGTVLVSGTPQEIINNQKVREVYLGKDFKF